MHHRSEFELHRALQQGSPEQAERWVDGEVYRDNLEVRLLAAVAFY